MKIALVTDGIQPYVIGGMQRHSYFIAKYLAQNNVYVDLYHCRKNREHDIHKLEVFTDTEKKFIRSFVIDFPSTKIRFPGHYLLSSYRYSEKIFDVLKKNLDGVDFIYCKGFSGWKLLEEKNTEKKFPPIGVKFHGLNMFQKPPSFRGWLEQLMFRPAVKFNMKYPDYVFSYGGKITAITKHIGIAENKIIEIPTGIEDSFLASGIRHPTSVIKFLYVGRYERLKGIQEISEAIKNLSRGKNFEFHFIGPIPEKLQLKNKEVKYYGQISSAEEIKKIMDECDFLLLPSYSEGMPNVIIEAMARGLAIIATDVGAVNCLVDSENGFLLNECSVKNIEDAMVAVISLSQEKLIQMKNNSLKKIRKNFLWENIAVKLIAELQKIISHKSTSHFS